jgi:NADH-quinone oxidoreductase subunit G
MTAPGMTESGRHQDLVTVTIDDTQVQAAKGELLIKVAQENGVFIPRFCWHERMKPVGMCRMCLVEIEGMRGFPPACTTPVADGMVCRTTTDTVKKIQDGVLEFLLINHPLDCPVCDRGGECPLQDQTLAFGPGESRFIEEKRHFEKPIPLSHLVLLDRERCIQCARCTRFAEEIAGDPLIDFVDRSEQTQVLNFAEQPFDSYFSGNTVQICPVGALTATQYRFRARPWDLSTAETSCSTCAVHCRGAVQSSSNRLVRLLGVDSDPVNHGWLCDKGRYGIEWVHSDERVLDPHKRVGGALTKVSWPEALDEAAEELQRVLTQHGPHAIAVLGGARGTNEDAYLWSRFAKSVVGTDNVDAQLGDGLPPEMLLGVPRAEIADCDGAGAIVLLGPDLSEELPVLFLRLRRAAIELGVPLVDLAPVAHRLTEHAAIVERTRPGEPVAPDVVARVTELASTRGGPVVVVIGRASLAESSDAMARTAAALLGSAADVRYLSALRRSNVHGALDHGLAAGFLPGRVTLDAGREWFAGRWGSIPERAGLDASGILRAAADGNIHVLFLLGADPLADFPDAALARRGLDGAGFVIAIDAFLSESNRRADVFLPCTLWGEKSGAITNLEGRVQRVSRKVAAEGAAMDDWRIAAELALRIGPGIDFDLATVDEVANEIANVAPAQLGATAVLLRRARDGLVVPLREHLDEIVLRTRELTIMAEDGHGTSWDPIKVEGTAPADSTNVVEGTGTGATTPLTPGAGEPGDDPAAVAAAVEEAHTASTTAAAEAPALHVWDGAVDGASAPARDAYALRLVSGRQLYDAGRVVTQTPILRALARDDQVLRVHPQELARLGVSSGDEVRVTSSRTTLTLRVVDDVGVPPGVAAMAFTADGLGAAELIDADAPVTDLRVETIRGTR